MLAERGSPIGSTDGSRCQRCSLASPTSPCGPRLCRSECSSWLRIMRNQEERLENHRDPRYALTSPRTPSGSNGEDPSHPRSDPEPGEHVRADPVPGLPPLPPGIRETSGFRRKAFVHWRCLHENPRGIAHAAAHLLAHAIGAPYPLSFRSECVVIDALAGHRNTRQAPTGRRYRRSARAVRSLRYRSIAVPRRG